MDDIKFEKLKINPSELTETTAAVDAGRPWIGLLAKEQIVKQLEQSNQGMSDEFHAMILNLINEHVEFVVETIAESTWIGGEHIYGLRGGINDIIFVVITDVGRIAFGTDKLTYDADRPEFMKDGNLWSAFLMTIEEKRFNVIPTIIGWRLGFAGVAETNENIDLIRKEGGTPCLFIFAGKDKEKQKIGGLMTLLSMPANFETQKMMAGTPIDKSKMN